MPAFPRSSEPHINPSIWLTSRVVLRRRGSASARFAQAPPPGSLRRRLLEWRRRHFRRDIADRAGRSNGDDAHRLADIVGGVAERLTAGEPGADGAHYVGAGEFAVVLGIVGLDRGQIHHMHM